MNDGNEDKTEDGSTYFENYPQEDLNGQNEKQTKSIRAESELLPSQCSADTNSNLISEHPESQIHSQKEDLNGQTKEKTTNLNIEPELMQVDSNYNCNYNLNTENYEKHIQSQQEDLNVQEEDKPAILNEDLESMQVQYSIDSYYDLTNTPTQMTGVWKPFKKRENFTKGCKWSPDGSYFLINSDDTCLRTFFLPQNFWEYKFDRETIGELEECSIVKEGQLVYDFCWNPKMDAYKPETFLILSTSRHTPIHMWNLVTREIVARYHPIDNVDEISSAYSIAFNPAGDKIFAGFKKHVRVFDVNRPGRQVDDWPTYTKKEGGLTGIISCFAFDTENNFAIGSYSNKIAIYNAHTGEEVMTLEGHQGGVSHLLFSKDGTKLYTGCRKNSEVICWDVRYGSGYLYSMRRKVETNQRIHFDLSSHGRYLVSGNTNGIVTFWDTYEPPIDVGGEKICRPASFFQAHDDCASGVSFNPMLPLLLTSSGQRKFPEMNLDEESDELFYPEYPKSDNSVRLWWIGAKLDSF